MLTVDSTSLVQRHLTGPVFRTCAVAGRDLIDPDRAVVAQRRQLVHPTIRSEETTPSRSRMRCTSTTVTGCHGCTATEVRVAADHRLARAFALKFSAILPIASSREPRIATSRRRRNPPRLFRGWCAMRAHLGEMGYVLHIPPSR